MDELRLFLVDHGLEDRDVVDVFFKLVDVVAADDDVRNGGESAKRKKGPMPAYQGKPTLFELQLIFLLRPNFSLTAVSHRH